VVIAFPFLLLHHLKMGIQLQDYELKTRDHFNDNSYRADHLLGGFSRLDCEENQSGNDGYPQHLEEKGKKG